MIFAAIVNRYLRGAPVWRIADARDVREIARRRKIQRIEKQLRDLGHHQVAAMLERDEENKP